jgi:sugar lactone lactonase YvrE
LLSIFDSRACELGEGALWHPLRKDLIWFDIICNRMLSSGQSGPREWQFDEMHSAAGWIDAERIIVASETALWLLWLDDGRRQKICNLEASNPSTRSNDGRVDSHGGFWISTMGRTAEPGAGAIWRWYRGEIRQLFSNLTIPNSMCFDATGRFAYFTDTPTKQVLRVGLDVNGWPIGQPEIWLCLRREGLKCDGAVIDADGLFWVAQWGASRVAAYAPDGTLAQKVHVPVPQVSCPAFGGKDFKTLFCTSAFQGLNDSAIELYPRSGMTFSGRVRARGRAEFRFSFT